MFAKSLIANVTPIPWLLAFFAAITATACRKSIYRQPAFRFVVSYCSSKVHNNSYVRLSRTVKKDRRASFDRFGKAAPAVRPGLFLAKN